MIQKQENAKTNKRTAGRTDRLYFIGPFHLPSNKSCKMGQWKDKIAITNYVHFLYLVENATDYSIKLRL